MRRRAHWTVHLRQSSRVGSRAGMAGQVLGLVPRAAVSPTELRIYGVDFFIFFESLCGKASAGGSPTSGGPFTVAEISDRGDSERSARAGVGGRCRLRMPIWAALGAWERLIVPYLIVSSLIVPYLLPISS